LTDRQSQCDFDFDFEASSLQQLTVQGREWSMSLVNCDE
jgi:hypothetical protein